MDVRRSDRPVLSTAAFSGEHPLPRQHMLPIMP
jgi:hypothetical protein